MNRKTMLNLASGAFVAFLAFSTPALAQSTCEGGGRETQASCGGDTCSCASPCTSGSQCNSGCCDQGFCALSCVCAGQGSVNINCGSGGGGGCGCGGGTVAPTANPLAGGMPMLWGFGLIGLGLVASARFVRKNGIRSAGTIASLSLCLLGTAFVTASAFENNAAQGQKALKVAQK